MFKNVKFLVLWLTNDCNLRCKYCYANAGEKNEYMTFETARKALEMPKSKFKLQLAGGEPLLNFNLVKDIYNYLKVNNPEIKIQMQTNGALINSEVAKEIKKMDISLGVSLDGPIGINEKLRGKTKDVINGIKILAQEGIMVNLNCVVTNESIQHLHKLVDLALYLGNVGGIGLDLLRETGRASNGEVKKATPSQIEKHLKEAYNRSIELYKLTGRKIIIREIEDARKRITENNICTDYCHAVYGGSMVVHPDGSLYPCGSLSKDEKYYMGNISNLSSQREIRITNNKSESCKICKYEKICVGACPARNIINGKSSEINIEDCILRKTSFKIVEKEIKQGGEEYKNANY
ncbi:radical SAM/SPASM domain-containing protein [Clostridium senegalense]|uniref:Radical SAM protein n=1 Tax=Clostridium senegalense TaxID=1465809 RepID=A0A6M0H342_9CLOT|nr:radical SAM protein [Clostridium senegalense]NEU04604.1 radical SAM protein [Clostridium senegalense]